jgi:hypothetical protein
MHHECQPSRHYSDSPTQAWFVDQRERFASAARVRRIDKPARIRSGASKRGSRRRCVAPGGRGQRHQPISNNLEFSVDEGSGKTVVKLVDTETNTVLRQYPTKEALAIAKDIDRFQGLLINTEA